MVNVFIYILFSHKNSLRASLKFWPNISVASFKTNSRKILRGDGLSAQMNITN